MEYTEESSDDIFQQEPEQDEKSVISNSPNDEHNFLPDELRILGEVEYGDHENVKSKLLDPSFISLHKAFVMSGEVVLKALNKNLIDLIVDLKNAGYFIPNNLLLKAIKKGDPTSISELIASDVYSRSGIELELWYLLYKGFDFLAKRLQNSEPLLAVYETHKNEKLCNLAMVRALERKFDGLASKILRICPKAVDPEMIEVAVNTESLEFIRIIWTGRTDELQAKKNTKNKRNYKASIWNNLALNPSYEKKTAANRFLNIGFIVERLLEKGLVHETKRVLLWPEAADDDRVLEICVNMKQQGLARVALKHRKKEIKRTDFELSFKESCYWICLDMLRFKESKSVLLDKIVQTKVVELLNDGSTCYFASEFLSHTDIKYWNDKLVEKVNVCIMGLLKDSESFVKCIHPLLFIVLICEFLQKVSKISIFYKKICSELIEHLLSLGKYIEDTITEELELKFYLYSTDARGRSVLTIISENSFYSLLENNDLGSVVSNMWAGEKQTSGIMNASTLYKSFMSPPGSTGKLQFLEKISDDELYKFQYEQLVNSCKLRYIGQMLSTCLLVYFYTMMIFTATVNGSLENIAADKDSVSLLRISQVWIFGIFAERIMHSIFAALTKRAIVKDFWFLSDFSVFLLTVLLMSDIRILSSFETILIHSIILCLIWLRLFQVLLISDTYGPLLMIIFKMASDMITFLVVLFGTIFISSTMMTVMFGKYTNDNFNRFDYSLMNVFSICFGVFELHSFTKYAGFAAVFEGSIVFILKVLLINILIAILSITYQRESSVETAKFRSVLISAYSKWKWDEKYGVLILLPPPLSFFLLFILPFIFLSRNPEKITGLFGRFIFIFYVTPIFAFFSVFSSVFVVVIYFSSLNSFSRGGIKTTKNQDYLQLSSDEESEEEDIPVKIKAFSYRRAVVWVLIGWSFAVVSYIRDCFNFWTVLFKASPLELTESDKLISHKFLQNIHSTLSLYSSLSINLDMFLSSFCELDKQDLSLLLKSNPQEMKNRKRLIEKFFIGFLLDKNSRNISKEIIKAYIGNKAEYSESVFNHVKCIRVHLIMTALKKFRINLKKIHVKDIKIPKSLLDQRSFEVKQSLTYSKTLSVLQQKVVKSFKKLQKVLI